MCKNENKKKQSFKYNFYNEKIIFKIDKLNEL